MKLSTLASAVLFTSLATGTSLAQDELKPIVNAGMEINSSANASQQRIDSINDQIQTKLQKFKTVNKEIDGLLVYNQQMEKQIANQLSEMKNLNQSIDKVSVIERQITPLMLRMIASLEQFVALDVPFLEEERAKRLASLHEMMERADVAVSEKFRRVLEAYQVEVDYGRTIEAYTGLLKVDGQEKDVDFLRVGRLGLIYRSRDGSELGAWNQDKKTWETLPSTYRTQITKALRVAQKQVAPDMLMLPVTAAE